MGFGLAGTIILYNPENEVMDNILSYLGELDCLYVIDNTEKPDQELVTKIKQLPRIQYIAFGENKGVSYALNTALHLAKDFKFLLTMDQDSKFYDGMIKLYKHQIEEYYSKHQDTVAMYSVHYDGLPENNTENDTKIVERAITSGSIVNIDIANKIGGFDENLFIDKVDDEFCYRAQLNGYKILQLDKIKLHHHIGNPISIRIFGKKFAALNHGKVRKYYICRNNIYIMKKYPKVRMYCAIDLLKVFAKMIWVEPDKWTRTLFILKGIKDGLQGRMGRICL